jgi:hypothetical protein
LVAGALRRETFFDLDGIGGSGSETGIGRTAIVAHGTLA